MKKTSKRRIKKTKRGLILHASGQYRADIDGQTRYFGTDPKDADLKYDLYITTKLYWNRKYRQFVKEIAGAIRTFGKTIDEARSNYERFIAENWQNGPQPVPTQIIYITNIEPGVYDVKTIGDVANAYVNWCFDNRSDKHALNAKYVFRHLGKFIGRNMLIVNLTASNFLSYRKHCLKTTNARFNTHMRVIKAAFRRCRREQWLCVSKGWLEDLLDPLEQITIVSQEVSIFTPKEIRQVLESSPEQIKIIIMLALNCALGNKDIAGLKWKDINFKTGILDYRRPKTHKMRRTPLWSETISLLKSWKETRGFTDSDSLIFTTRNGNPWVRTIIKGDKRTPDDAIGKEFIKILKYLKIKRPRLSFYSIRHTATTWATEFADNDQLVKEGNEFLLGHAADEMWKRYSHAIPPSVKQAVAAIRRGWLDDCL